MAQPACELIVVCRAGFKPSHCSEAVAHVDQPFVMAMQMARFILVLLLGPALARTVARWSGS
jgi:hypothetical protein